MTTDADSSAVTSDEQAEATAVASADSSGPGQPPQAAGHRNRLIWPSIGLVTVAGLLRSRRFQEQVLIGVIGLAALAVLTRETQARILARLAAWDKELGLRDQRRARKWRTRIR